MIVEDRNFRGAASGRAAIEALREVIHENEKTKRLLIGAACFFVCVAACIAVFAPAGKEVISYIIGAALFVMAIGAIGIAKFKIEIPGMRMSAEQLELPLRRSPERNRTDHTMQ